MKTIQIIHRTVGQNKHLIKDLYKRFLKYDPMFHFFYEPDLIIRTAVWKNILFYLLKRKIQYKTYPYPYTKRGYGESKRWKYLQRLSENLYHTQAIFALTAKRRDMEYFSNRMHHCFLNMRGFEYYDESKYLVGQAAGYMRHEYNSDGMILTNIKSHLMRMLYKIL